MRELQLHSAAQTFKTAAQKKYRLFRDCTRWRAPWADAPLRNAGGSCLPHGLRRISSVAL